MADVTNNSNKCLSVLWKELLVEESISNDVKPSFWNKMDEQFPSSNGCFDGLHRIFGQLLKQLKIEASEKNIVSCGSNTENQLLFKVGNNNYGGFLFTNTGMTVEFNLIETLCNRIGFYRNFQKLAKSPELDLDPVIQDNWYKLSINSDSLPCIIILLSNWFSPQNQNLENNMLDSSVKKSKIITKSPLNQILFGPPGTGKTYHTIEAAVKAAAPESYATATQKLNTLGEPDGYPAILRKMLTEKYLELVAEKRIQFVTFHQSYGYEEFVEGLTASSVEGQVSYDVESGIFKTICDNAKNATLDKKDKPEKYVLIIDEINRGNISKIFGELITLIEPSKRNGNNEAIEVVLPNSKESFSVPNNLHIIGTMNTADRSLAMMDTALRRRFDFKEMMPKPELFENCSVAGINLTELLDTMNKRIEVLYDREHTLGHAFLFPVFNAMKADNEEQALIELQSVFQNKIIPLLEEYFYEDWSKIRLVLGDNQKKEQESLQFVRESKIEYNDLFGAAYQADEYGQPQNRYQLASFNDDVWSSAEAYIGIYEPKSSN